jgi:Arc/MetJ family transcription regulator
MSGTFDDPAGRRAEGHPIRSRCARTIDIDDRLMRQALRASGRTTKRGVVDEALKLLVQTRSQAAIRKLRGRIRWEG